MRREERSARFSPCRPIQAGSRARGSSSRACVRDRRRPPGPTGELAPDAAFLGEIPAAAVRGSRTEVAEAAAADPAGRAHLRGRALLFPAHGPPRVLAVGFAPASRARKRGRRLCREARSRAARRLGLAAETAALPSPRHARAVAGPLAGGRGRALPQRGRPAGPFRPGRRCACVLYESRLGPSGAVHTPLRGMGPRGGAVRGGDAREPRGAARRPGRLPARFGLLRGSPRPLRDGAGHPEGGLGKRGRDQRAARPREGARAARRAARRREGRGRRVWFARLLTRRIPGTPPRPESAAVLGHVFPLFYGFRGGKGVATAVGAFLVLAPAATATCIGIFALVVAADPIRLARFDPGDGPSATGRRASSTGRTVRSSPRPRRRRADHRLEAPSRT